MVEISVIVRTKNEEKWIRQCLERVAEQSVDNVGVVLVDNESTDKTVNKARQVYPDLTLVTIEDYLPGLALNEGVRASTGEFIVCLSAHCVPVDDDWLATLRRNFDREDEVAGVYGRQIPVESTDPVDKRDLIRTFGPEHRVQDRDSFFHNANSMLRREVWDEFPFSEGVTNIEDQIWGNEVIETGYTLVYEPDAAVYHHHGINQGNDAERTRSVVQTMEANEIRPDEDIAEGLAGGPLDPRELDVVAFVPIRQHAEHGVDFDESLIIQTVEAVQTEDYVNDVVLLTDSEHVAEQAAEWGASAPFLRPPELSEREVEVTEVYKFGIEELEREDRIPDLVVPIEITHPFRHPGLVDDMVEQLLREGLDTIVAAYPEYRPCYVERNERMTRINKDTVFRHDRDPVYIGLPGLGVVTHPRHLRNGERIGGTTDVYEVDDPLATVEIRQREDLSDWERLREIEQRD